MSACRARAAENSSLSSGRFLGTLHKRFRIAGVMMKMLSRDYSRTSKGSTRPHTLLASGLVNLKPRSDRRADNGGRPEMPAAGSAGTKEMKLAVLSWEQTDIFLSHGDASGEDDC